MTDSRELEEVTVRLPRELAARARQAAQRGGWSDLGEMLAFLLGEVLADEDEAMTEQETRVLEERLRALGYLG